MKGISLALGAHRAPQGAIHIMSEKLTDNPDFPRGLYLRNMDGTLWLRGYVCSDDYPFPADALLAFCVD